MITTLASVEREAMLFVRHLMSAGMHRTERPLDRSAYAILTCLSAGRALSLGELSREMNLDVSTLSRQTTAMLRSGLIERILDPTGGLARKLQATEHGEQRLHEACSANIAVLNEAMADWSAEELAAFAGLLERFNRGFGVRAELSRGLRTAHNHTEK